MENDNVAVNADSNNKAESDVGQSGANATPSTDNNATIDATSEASSTATLCPESTEEPIETTNTFILKFSIACRPFGLAEYPEIARVATEHFGDPMANVTWRRVGSEKIYKIELSKQYPKYGNSLTFLIQGQTFNVDLLPYVRRPRGRNQIGSRGGDNRDNRDNNLLLTFYQAGQLDYSHIPMKQFDGIIQNELGLILEKATENQKIYKTQIFNGNRYCVVRKPENLAVIPAFLPLIDPVTKEVHHFRVGYSGQLYNCGRCLKQHPGPCPELREFHAAKEERERMEQDKEINTKIISDSTLRHVEQTGLRADVMTMSGGGLGQIVQAAIDDPDVKDKQHVVILGGANDIKNDGFENDAEYAQNIKTTIDKVLDLASNNPTKKITLINSHPNANENVLIDNEEKILRKTREHYLHRKLEEVVEKMPNMDVPVNNVDIIDVQYDVDETGHPTIEGTREILETIHDLIHIDPKIIWNPTFVTNDKLYKGVQSIYRYGCNHCNGFGQQIQRSRHNNGNVCDDCMDLLKANAPLGDSLIDKIRKEVSKTFEDPPLKRDAPDEESDEERNSKVVCISKNDSTKEDSLGPNNENGSQEEDMES